MRLIDADALKAVFEEKSSEAVCGVELCKAIISRIDEAPTVDAVQVVRCGDCKEFNQYETETGECMKYAQTRWKDNFCNYGKRRKND